MKRKYFSRYHYKKKPIWRKHYLTPEQKEALWWYRIGGKLDFGIKSFNLKHKGTRGRYLQDKYHLKQIEEAQKYLDD